MLCVVTETATGELDRQQAEAEVSNKKPITGCYLDVVPDVYVPAGWPEAVTPPGSQDGEIPAVAVIPRHGALVPAYEMVSRRPAILARIARHHIHGGLEGAREGYRPMRADLVDQGLSLKIEVAGLRVGEHGGACVVWVVSDSSVSGWSKMLASLGIGGC